MTRFPSLLLACLALLLASPALGQESRAIDGDSIALSVRLKGYDAPETLFAKCKEERDLGEKAKARLAEILSARNIRIVPALRSDGSLQVDKYGRALATIYVGKENLADIFVQEGLAVAYERGRRISWCKRLGAQP